MQESIYETKISIEISKFQCLEMSLGFQMKVCFTIKNGGRPKTGLEFVAGFCRISIQLVNRVFNSIAAG